MQEIQCPQCGEWLGVPPEYADRPVRCAGCGRVIAPAERAATTIPPPPPPRPAPAGVGGLRFPDHEDDIPTTPRKKGGALWVWALVTFVVFAGCCGGGGVALFMFANPKWKTFEQEKGEFSAQFPGKPTYESKAFNWPDGTVGTVHQYKAGRLNNAEGFAVHYVDIPKNRPRGSDEFLLNAILDDFRKSNAVEFAETASEDVTVDGHPGKDVEGAFTDPKYGPGYAYGRVLLVGDRIYLLVAIGKDQKRLTRDRGRFFDSFNPTEPKEK